MGPASAGSITGACAECLRRAWLLGELSGVLDCNSRADGRLLGLLALPDRELIEALGGRRRQELRQHHAEFSRPEQEPDGAIAAICRHDRRYPARLRHPVAPDLLYVAGELDRLQALASRPVVAFPGMTRASDYGLELAHGLARGLGASGLTISAGRSGLAQAALAGALEAGAATLLVAGHGLCVEAAPGRAMRERLTEHGCAVAELPPHVGGRRWGANAAERIVVSLADVVIVVEAEDSPRALASPRLASELGRTVTACPGRVTSRASSGSHVLLREGARLVTGAADVLDLLYAVDPHDPPRPSAAAKRALRGGAPPPPALAPRLRFVLEQVGAGVDTPGALTAGSSDPGELLRALGELESLGLLSRGDGGRYLVCAAPV